jgi:PTH1 family peptidyl-tRNA hydrolase
MKLIVGLGNPGRDYASHRHNVGFMVVDELARRGNASWSAKFKGEQCRADVGGTPTILLKPQTYMNRSGESVQPCAAFFDVAVADILVVHDELDVPYGDVRLKLGGGHAGHNGLRSIFQHAAPKGDFPRVRVGIGRPQHGDVAKFVLSPFSTDERIDLDLLVARAADACTRFVEQGIGVAMNQFNGAAPAKAGSAGAKSK